MANAVSKLIDSFEMTCYRRILRVTWTEHRINESIRNELEVKENWSTACWYWQFWATKKFFFQSKNILICD